MLEALSTADRILDETTDGQGSRSLADADALRTGAYNAALASNDAAFHSRLYDWFIEKGRTDQLLGVRQPVKSLPDARRYDRRCSKAI